MRMGIHLLNLKKLRRRAAQVLRKVLLQLLLPVKVVEVAHALLPVDFFAPLELKLLFFNQ